MAEINYDHDAYSERLGEAQACLAHYVSLAMSDGLEEMIGKIVELDELCDPDAPHDGLYDTTFFLVMQRLLHTEALAWTRVE